MSKAIDPAINSLLDLDNAKGRGEDNADESLPSEHGRWITNEDIAYNGFTCVESVDTFNKHRILFKEKPKKEKTLIFLPGGAGRVHAVTPDLLVMPTNYINLFPNDFNIVSIDYDHNMGWSFAREVERVVPPRGMLIGSLSNKAINMMPAGPVKKLMTGLLDLEKVLQQIKIMFPGEHWISGHCNSCELLSKHYAFYPNPTYQGMIFLSPSWRNSWKETIGSMQYFAKTLEIPLLSIAHKYDSARVVGVELTHRISEQSKSPRREVIEVEGGTDNGLPHFSMGHHGFFGIDKQIIDHVTKFVNAK
jgi:hypothetical protein